MKFLITGATGFIGSSLVAELLKSGVPASQLVLLQRSPIEYKSTLIFERLKVDGKESLGECLEFHVIDYDDSQKFIQQLENFARGPYVVVHLAAMIHAKASQMELQYRINVEVTKELAEFCTKHAYPFIYLSSVVAFGGNLTSALRSEKDFSSFFFVNQMFPYYKTKREIHEKLLQIPNLKGVLLCPSIVHGAFEDRKDSRGHIKALIAGKLSWAPPGGGNIVGLDRVVGALIREMHQQHSVLLTKLVIDKNVTYAEYFQKIVNLALVNPPRIKTVPHMFVWLIFLIYWPFSFFFKVNGLLGLFQATLFLYFNSDYEQTPSAGAFKALEEAYRK